VASSVPARGSWQQRGQDYLIPVIYDALREQGDIEFAERPDSEFARPASEPEAPKTRRVVNLSKGTVRVGPLEEG
jgi:hypothetical protein